MIKNKKRKLELKKAQINLADLLNKHKDNIQEYSVPKEVSDAMDVVLWFGWNPINA